MKSEKAIRERAVSETDKIALDTLDWVLENEDCSFCSHHERSILEIKVFRQEVTPSFLENKYGWPIGTVTKHMREHIVFDVAHAQHMEVARQESISTLNVAEDLVQRMLDWLNELETQKKADGIDSDWVANATKLAGQLNNSLKLVGQLKKEIGVDSQLLLADKKIDTIMGVLVDVLQEQPNLLDQIELRMAALKAPEHIVYED